VAPDLIIAVSVDPRGDTPKTVAKFLAQHEMTGRMQYLLGSASELARVWKAWGVGSERDVKNPNFVEHSGLIYGITGFAACGFDPRPATFYLSPHTLGYSNGYYSWSSSNSSSGGCTNLVHFRENHGGGYGS